MVKGDVEEVEEDMLRRMGVNARICCCGRKVADLKIYLFSATKQDRVGPSLQSRNSFLHLQLAIQTVQLNWICRLGRYFMIIGFQKTSIWPYGSLWYVLALDSALFLPTCSW